MPDGAVIPNTVSWLEGSTVHEYVVVDVFTPRPLEGNQLAVFLDGRPFGPQEMQRLAREMQLAETVFLFPPQAGGDVSVRIFTPAEELPFAGHPVLGTAFVAGQALGAESLTLETGAGPVPVTLERQNGKIVFGRMQQPIPVPEPYEQQSELLSALGLEFSGLPIELYHNGPAHVYVALSGEQAVAQLRPDMVRLADLGVAANCFAGREASWKTRMFCPAAGVPEDAATGSAAGPLALHLVRHGRIAFGQEIEIHQGQEIDRPSLLYARVTGAPGRIESIEVGGRAQIVGHGHYRVSAG
jgi:trans-2,3-dihydro-3-hydroxyanthranilate isomerase